MQKWEKIWEVVSDMVKVAEGMGLTHCFPELWPGLSQWL